MESLKGIFNKMSTTTATSTVTVHRLSQSPRKAWETLKVKQVVQKVEPQDPMTPITEDKIRFVCISDTHSQIESFNDFIPPGDVLLHAGDITQVGHPSAIAKFNTYLGYLPHKVKIVIAGNHDLTMDLDMVKNHRRSLQDRFGLTECHTEVNPVGFGFFALFPQIDKFEKVLEQEGVKCSRDLLAHCIYLEDSSVDVCGIKIYGSPWQPEFGDWGYNLPRGEACLEKWNKIPEDTDILMTHGPPIGHGDHCFDGNRAGCVELLATIQKRVKPCFHVFGHIHEGYGITTDGVTTYINASTCTLRYQPYNKALVFDFPIPEGHSKEELLHIPVNNLNPDVKL